MSLDRRTFLKTGLFGLGASLLGPTSFLRLAGAHPGGADLPVLVVLQLSGGNDGLSTVVPYGDDAYHNARKATAIPTAEVLKLAASSGPNSYVGLNPKLTAMRALFDRGDLAIVQGCSYPNPNRSHFKSMDVWHAASPDGRRKGTGWLGRAVDRMHPDSDSPDLIAALGSTVPFALQANRHKAVAFTGPGQYCWRGQQELKDAFVHLNCEEEALKESNAGFLHRVAANARASSKRMREAAEGYQPKAKYPNNRLAKSLGLVTGLIAGGLPTRVYYVSLGSFDTHNQQRNRHDRLMDTFGSTVSAFLTDLDKHGLKDRVTLMAFSEFGRRVNENGSAGTDHGVAGPMFLMGSKVQGGLYGEHPSLTDLSKGDLKMTTDFRSVYQSVMEGWLGLDSAEAVLGARYRELDLFGEA